MTNKSIISKSSGNTLGKSASQQKKNPQKQFLMKIVIPAAKTENSAVITTKSPKKPNDDLVAANKLPITKTPLGLNQFFAYKMEANRSYLKEQRLLNRKKTEVEEPCMHVTKFEF